MEKSCGYDDNGDDGGGGGDSAYTDDVGGKLRCRIIIMPAFFALASMPCEVANARQA